MRAEGLTVRGGAAPAAATLRIVVDGRVMQDAYHGIGRYTYELVRRLATRDVELVVVHDPTAPGRLDVPGLADHDTVRLVDLAVPVVAASAQLRWPAVLAATRPDVLLAPYHLATPWVHPRVPTVTVMHDCIFERDPRYRPGGTRFAVAYRAATRLALARSSAVAAVSQATRAELRRHYGLELDTAAVIPHGVGEQFLALGRQRADRPRDPARGTRYVLHVGVHRPHKNHAVLLAAFAEVARSVPDVRLVLVGTPDPRFGVDVPALVRAHGLGERVDVLTSVGEQDLLRLYRDAEVFAFPSLAEGFGLPVLEAMAAGVPAVISDDPAVSEVGGEACLVAPAADARAWATALTRILTQPELAGELAARGRTAAAAHTWDRAADQTLGLLTTISRRTR